MIIINVEKCENIRIIVLITTFIITKVLILTVSALEADDGGW